MQVTVQITRGFAVSSTARNAGAGAAATCKPFAGGTRAGGSHTITVQRANDDRSLVGKASSALTVTT